MCSLVRLQHEPIIIDGPHNQTVSVGDTVRFTCDLLSDPEYHLQWLKHLDEDIVVHNETKKLIVLHVSLVTHSHSSSRIIRISTQAYGRSENLTPLDRLLPRFAGLFMP